MDVSIGKKPVVHRPWRWTKPKIDACRMVAEGTLTIRKIGEAVGVTDSTIYNWMDHPEFANRRDGISRQFDQYALSRGLALKRNRMEALENIHERHKIIITERAETHKDLTGGSSGLIAVEDRKTGYGDNEEWVQDLVFDGTLSREYRAVLSQVAEETGQLVSKHELTGADGGPIAVTFGVLDDIAGRVRAAREQRAAREKTAQASPALLSSPSARNSPEGGTDEVGGD